MIGCHKEGERGVSKSPQIVTQSASAIDSQLARALSASVCQNGYYFWAVSHVLLCYLIGSYIRSVKPATRGS